MPSAGVLDPDLLYRILISPAPRVAFPMGGDPGLDDLVKYFDAIRTKYLGLKAMEARVRVDKDNRAKIDLIDFPGGPVSTVIDTNRPGTITAPDGSVINAFVGGRDDAFFNDLPGFFRSINYAPQFYHVPLSMTSARELPIPKTLLELEGNTLFNFDPANPLLGQGVKKDLPPGPYELVGKPYQKDANGKYRFVYSGKDAQAGRNINAIILELPLAYITKTPATDRIVNTWGESWVLKASGKIPAIPDSGAVVESSLLNLSDLMIGALVALGLFAIGFAVVKWRRHAPAASLVTRPAVRADRRAGAGRRRCRARAAAQASSRAAG